MYPTAKDPPSLRRQDTSFASMYRSCVSCKKRILERSKSLPKDSILRRRVPFGKNIFSHSHGVLVQHFVDSTVKGPPVVTWVPTRVRLDLTEKVHRTELVG